MRQLIKMGRNSLLLLWLLSLVAHLAGATPVGLPRGVAGPRSAMRPCGLEEEAARLATHESPVRAGPGSSTAPISFNPTGLVLMWRLGERAEEEEEERSSSRSSRSGRGDRASGVRRVQRRRSVTEKQLMNDKAHNLYARQRQLWLKSVMGHLNTARRGLPAGAAFHDWMGGALGLDEVAPSGDLAASSSSSSWVDAFGSEESPDFRGENGA
uniref:Uncharacterized protein LOC116944462 n=1 Tax=Petromyzon marinus TaxID=7757 RepID=A0AAJ7WXU3_PETMA|nr:uncharacterized protein LOC116944462 [Petromyzon marinus]